MIMIKRSRNIFNIIFMIFLIFLFKYFFINILLYNVLLYSWNDHDFDHDFPISCSILQCLSFYYLYPYFWSAIQIHELVSYVNPIFGSAFFTFNICNGCQIFIPSFLIMCHWNSNCHFLILICVLSLSISLLIKLSSCLHIQSMVLYIHININLKKSSIQE